MKCYICDGRSEKEVRVIVTSEKGREQSLLCSDTCYREAHKRGFKIEPYPYN